MSKVDFGVKRSSLRKVEIDGASGTPEIMGNGLKFNYSTDTSEGVVRFDTSSKKIQYHNGTNWVDCGSGCTLPTFAASGNAGVPDPLKYYPLESDAVDAVDGDTPTVSGTISYAYSASLRRNVAYFDANAYLRYSTGNVADYRILGEMSGMVFFETKSANTATAGKPIIAVQSASDLEADNALWSVLQTDSVLSFFSEYGAGTNDDRVVTGVKLNAYSAWIYGWVRAADGVTVRHFIDGTFVLETTAASAPTGGTTAEFIVQYAFALSREAKAIGQIAIWDSALTDDQMISAHELAAPALCGIC